MKFSVCLLLVLLIVACSNSNKNDLPLFNDLVFQLSTGESVSVLSENTKHNYTTFFNQGSVQVPLFKSIHHPQYEMFIGIPYTASIREMIQNQLENQDSVTIDIRSDSLSYYKKSAVDNIYLAEYAEEFKGGTIIYIATMANSQESIDSLFSELQLSARIISKKP